MNTDILTHLVAFLAGTLTGAAGKYLGDKCTDQRRRQEATKKELVRFRSIREKVPSLIEKIRSDLDTPEDRLIREFFVARKSWTINMGGPAFRYDEEDHEHLKAAVAILENSGYVLDVTPSDVPKYRMTEEFVDLVLKSK